MEVQGWSCCKGKQQECALLHSVQGRQCWQVCAGDRWAQGDVSLILLMNPSHVLSLILLTPSGHGTATKA